MGSRKTKLARSDRYGLLKAAELAAEMISDYEHARVGAYEIRVESLEEAVWDDVVVKKRKQPEKWQVKRLMTTFDTTDAAEIIESAAGIPDGTKLTLAVASFVPIKHGTKVVCEMRRLAELCADAKIDGLVPADFARVQASNAAFQFVRRSIKPASDENALSVLRRLEVVELGLEDRIRGVARMHLQNLFVDADEIVEQVH